MRIYLIRHPQPEVGPGICYGRSDLGVSAARQAHALTNLLPALPARIPVFSSPAARCAGLAADLARALGSAPPRYDARLAEMDFGDWEMRGWNEIACAEVDAWNADLAHYRPGGGESVLQVAQRVSAFHDELLAMPHESAAVVCHAGAIRLFNLCGQGLASHEMALRAAGELHRIAYGELAVIER